jgi:hypothetical protein
MRNICTHGQSGLWRIGSPGSGLSKSAGARNHSAELNAGTDALGNFSAGHADNALIDLRIVDAPAEHLIDNDGERFSHEIHHRATHAAMANAQRPPFNTMSTREK